MSLPKHRSLPFSDVPLWELDLSKRASAAVDRLGVLTLAELWRLPYSKLLGKGGHNCGPGTVQDLGRAMLAAGLRPKWPGSAYESFPYSSITPARAAALGFSPLAGPFYRSDLPELEAAIARLRDGFISWVLVHQGADDKLWLYRAGGDFEPADPEEDEGSKFRNPNCP
jgi:hypothetical protein